MLRAVHVVGLGIALAVVLVAGCGKSPEKAVKTGLTIGVSQCSTTQGWRKQLGADLKAAAAKHPDLNLIFKDANDAAKQQAQVQEFIASKVALIIISPQEAQALTEPVAQAYRAGIPVVVVDRAVIGDEYTCFIGGDNKKVGQAAGAWLAKKLDGKGKVVELRGLTTSAAEQDRHAGFREALIKHPEMRVLFEADTKWLEPEARKAMEEALSRFDKIDAVYAHNDAVAHGAYLAAQAVGREKEMLFVGSDALPEEGLRYLKEGVLNATIQYPTGGAEAIDAAVKILAGQKVPKKITLDVRLFTPENLDRGGDVLE